MDEPKDKPRQTVTQQAVDIKRMRALELRRTGMSTQAIADELGVARQTVSGYLNSRDVKEIIKAAQDRLKSLLDPAVDVYAMSLKNAKGDMTNAQKAAKDILKTFGVIKENLELSHVFPKPTVIKRVDGTEVILGTKNEDDEK
jgi:predicted transcriptional regulator